MSTPILIHLSEYLCEMYHFYQRDPSNFKNSIQFAVNFLQKHKSRQMTVN